MITKDYLPNHKEITVYQDDEMFRINTDTQVLGEFIKLKKTDNVLDMGTNNGSLLLYASLQKPMSLTGLEINEKALVLAKRNMEENNISNYTLINDNIITFKAEREFDVIICNPPYFKTEEDNKADNSYKNLAKHEGELTLKALVKSIERNLKYSGTLFFLFLTSRLDEVLIELNNNNLIPKEIQFVYDDKKPYSNVFMVRCVKNAKQGLNALKPIIIKR